jgi:gas vesicle structural protein
MSHSIILCLFVQIIDVQLMLVVSNCQERDFPMAIEKSMASSSLAEVVDRILDKGIVIDAWARVSLVGIELLAIEARIVIAGVDTYLKYAEAVGLTLQAQEA